MIPQSLIAQYGSPHLPRLDAGGLAYRPSGIYSMEDQRSTQREAMKRDAEQKKRAEDAQIRALIENAYSQKPVVPLSLKQILSGMDPAYAPQRQ